MLELREFFVQGGDQDKSHVLLHITEPSSQFEQQTRGYFFAVAEINNGTVEQIEHLQQMIDDLESNYYETDDENNQSSFETILEHINRRGHHILNSQLSKISCAVGVIHNNKISFSYHGQPAIKMIYSKHNTFEILDIIKDEEEKTQEQLFSSIMQGKINEGDFFYIATPHIAEKISDNQILKLLPTHEPKQSALYLQKTLAVLRDDISYGGIIFHLSANQVDYAPEKKNTKKIILKPKVETNFRPREIEDKEPLPNIILINIGRALVSGAVGIYRLLKSIIFGLGKFLIGAIILTTNTGGQRNVVLQSFNDALERKKTYLRNLPLTSKILFILTILLFFIFVGNLGYLNVKEKIKIKEQAYKNKIQAIVDKKTAAEASMIYDDEIRAFDLLKEAKNLIAELPDNSQAQKNKILELQTEIQASLKILQKMNTIKPEIITNLTQIQTSAQATKLALIGDEIIAYGPSDLFIYKINVKTNLLNKIEHQNIPYFISANTPKEQDKIIFLTKDNTIAEYSPKSSTISAKEMPLFDKASLSSIFIYSQKLYTADTANNQIFKHNQTQTGYDKGAAWIKNKDADLSDIISFAIDGDLFALKSNGDILKYTSGNRQAFTISGLDPALNKPTELWTYNNVKNLYVLEPANKRVVILDKQGKLLQQYTAAEWTNPTGILVDEEKKVIYVLDNNIIYRFGIE